MRKIKEFVFDAGSEVQSLTELLMSVVEAE